MHDPVPGVVVDHHRQGREAAAVTTLLSAGEVAALKGSTR
jgi:hypothetical protein